MSIKCFAILSFFFFGRSQAFLATPLNTSDPDVINILCPEQASGETRDHEWITREGIRRSIRKFFIANPPPDSPPDFFLPEDATLSEIYHGYYGETMSPTRFIKAVNSIAAANVKTDSAPQTRYDPAIQGDGEHIIGLQESLTLRYTQIMTSILVEEAYSAARALLGTSLHSLQKFYSHSTWIEQGNAGILEDLGIPGGLIPAVANPTEAVCTPCPSSQGECTDNVILGTGLSSGYYNYVDSIGDGFLIPKPPTGGKCSHGGRLDDSTAVPEIGGVNKDTAYPCFSPHHYLHDQAAELAIQATEYYLENILNAVGDVKYRRLFDLYMGSALSICIDTTGSMQDDIDAVKAQVAEIVNNVETELYILVPYNSPVVGPLTKTDDPQVFLDAVNALYATNSDELFCAALQLALSATPDYGSIFCFTDDRAQDAAELMESVTALAQLQHNSVTVILSDILQKENEPKEGYGEKSPRLPVDPIDQYRYITEATGGLLISTDKFDVADIVGIMGGGVATSTVTIVNLIDISGPRDNEVLIDDSVVDFEIRLEGILTNAILEDVTGYTYDLMDASGLNALPDVEVISHTDSFKAIKWTTPNFGVWRLQTLTPNNYTISVIATSSFDFLGDFAILDPSPPHPHYRQVEGRPLMNTIYYLELTLIGHLESEVVLANKIEFINKEGIQLRQIDYLGEVKDQIYIRTDPLPETPFFIRLSGKVSSGRSFNRLLPVQVIPVQTKVEVWATSQDLSAKPGESSVALFYVTNYGLESNFDITGTDDMKFLTYLSDTTIYLGTNGSYPIYANFTVPLGTTHGTVSTIIITAKSQKQSQSVNSAVAHFIVLPEEQDLVKPLCVLTNTPDCTDFSYNGVCNLQEWLAEADLKDDKSGLYSVYARPEGTAIDIVGFTPGTTATVFVDYRSTCCSLVADIIGVDGQGNVGLCHIDMGILGGLIIDFDVDSVGDTWALLHWNITPSIYEVSYYLLEVNDGSNLQQIPCQDSYCQALVAYLDACAHQNFNLTPVFDYLGTPVEGFAAYTYTITGEDGVPEAPYNGTEIDATETSVTIAWEAAVCSSEFEVCYYEVGEDPSTGVCGRTSQTNFVITGLSKCKAYFTDVVAISPSGQESVNLQFYSVTLCPGPNLNEMLRQWISS
ncbi:hypothetical protein SK128_001406 [Halocaridina rubra]|uniref:Fibronectin type-III domain-containing protein n=1 Tax=Halocaridina rubra TaxID=373956 RepID=A0AAN9AHM2_HALRR